MANINVRGISDKTKESLRVRAAKAGMSLEAYARRALTKAATANGDEPKPLVDLAEKYFGARHGVELDLPSRSTQRKPVELG
jgi:plasmid stability protein